MAQQHEGLITESAPDLQLSSGAVFGEGQLAEEGSRQLGGMALRIFISPTRSGSTALLHCFANNPYVDTVFHQPVKSGYRQDGTFDYSFFELGNDEFGNVLVAKETVGGFAVPEAIFSPLPNHGENVMVGPWLASPEEIRRVQPLILIRDPLQTWNSIDKLNRYSEGISEFHSPFEYFVTSYTKVAEFLFAAKRQDLPVHVVTQEMLAEDPHGIMAKLCGVWGIPYDPAMVEWTLPYGAKTWFSKEAMERFENDPRFQYSKKVLQESTRYDYRPSSAAHIDAATVGVIDEQLRPLYERARQYAEQDFVRV